MVTNFYIQGIFNVAQKNPVTLYGNAFNKQLTS